MKELIFVIIFIIISSPLFSQDYKGEIFFKNNNSIYAKDINLHKENITFIVGREKTINTVDNSKIDYLLVNDGSYFWESFAIGIAIGAGSYFIFSNPDNNRTAGLLLTTAATTLASTLIGTLIRKKKRINLVGNVDTSFLNGVNIMPFTCEVNYQLVNFSVGL